MFSTRPVTLTESCATPDANPRRVPAVGSKGISDIEQKKLIEQAFTI
jgi:hypothetical protein